MEGALQAVEPPLRGHAFDGLDAASFAAHGERDAGWYRLAVDQDRAGAALAAVATGLRARQMGDVAQVIDQQIAIGDGVFAPAPVELQAQQTLLRWRARCVHRMLPKGTVFGVEWVQTAMTKIKLGRARGPYA